MFNRRPSKGLDVKVAVHGHAIYVCLITLSPVYPKSKTINPVTRNKNQLSKKTSILLKLIKYISTCHSSIRF